MRNFRNAAVASATAAALVLGGATVATAEPTNPGSSTEDSATEQKSPIFAGKLEGDGEWPKSAQENKEYFATDR